MGRWYLFLLGALATWRFTHLLYAEDGPFDVFARMRRSGARLFECFYCLSVWIALPLALWLGAEWRERALLWPALSAAAILIERLTTPAPPPASYHEDEEEPDALLRKDPAASADDRAASADDGGGSADDRAAPDHGRAPDERRQP